MLRIHLKGQRSNRTPLAYPEYRKLFQKRLEYVDNPSRADLLVYSCFMDIRNEAEMIAEILAKNPGIKLVVLSEEPYWDSLWSDSPAMKKGHITLTGRICDYTFLNHSTTGIYDFAYFPYFLTTHDDYFARYSFLFSRNTRVSPKELLSFWHSAPVRAAFFAEFRLEATYDSCSPRHDVQGLSNFRTQLAQEVHGNGILRVGHGWGTPIRRQSLPDWHLDKLTTLDRRALLVSAIENTHQENYISEKIFDAFATLGVPLYFASPLHWITRLTQPETFLNLYGMTTIDAAQRVMSFVPDTCFACCYLETQAWMAKLFTNPRRLAEERQRVVAEVVSALNFC